MPAPTRQAFLPILKAPARRVLLQAAAALAATGALTGLPGLAAPTWAQEAWPSRPVRFIVPYAAGGFADTRARKLSEPLSRALGQPVVIENRAGAGGVTGTDAIARATDGHTFGFGSPAPLVT